MQELASQAHVLSLFDALQVLVSIRNSSNIPAHVQVAALQTLASVLDSAALRSVDVSGCNIVIGKMINR